MKVACSFWGRNFISHHMLRKGFFRSWQPAVVQPFLTTSKLPGGSGGPPKVILDARVKPIRGTPLDWESSGSYGGREKRFNHNRPQLRKKPFRNM